jgi:hypothetical protein
MKLLDKYLDLQKEIYDHFGYKEDWAVIPIEDARQYFWTLNKYSVWFAEKARDLISQDGDYYKNEIYTQRHLPKWVYESEEYTMICVDTRTDGNKFLQIFDNSKRIYIK